MKINPFFRVKPPKPKPKGHKKKVLKTPPKIKGLDVFKVILEGDAGREGSGNSGKDIKEHLHKLSKPELTKLERMIDKVRSKSFKNNPKSKKNNFLYDEFSDALEAHVQKVAKIEEKFRKKIQKKWVRLKEELEISVQDGKVQGKDIECPLGQFIRKKFSSELIQIEEYIDKGLLIRSRKGGRGTGLIKRWILVL